MYTSGTVSCSAVPPHYVPDPPPPHPHNVARSVGRRDRWRTHVSMRCCARANTALRSRAIIRYEQSLALGLALTLTRPQPQAQVRAAELEQSLLLLLPYS